MFLIPSLPCNLRDTRAGPQEKEGVVVGGDDDGEGDWEVGEMGWEEVEMGWEEEVRGWEEVERGWEEVVRG
jgi:hypothetical protein